MLSIRILRVPYQTPYPIYLFYRDFSLTSETNKGHSKWQNIKDVKGRKDAEKSSMINLFIKKLPKAISEGGGGFDPKYNKPLSNLLVDYRKAGLPMETINRRMDEMKEDSAQGKESKT